MHCINYKIIGLPTHTYEKTQLLQNSNKLRQSIINRLGLEEDTKFSFQPKITQKGTFLTKILLILRGFWVLVPLNFDGRILNLEN